MIAWSTTTAISTSLLLERNSDSDKDDLDRNKGFLHPANQSTNCHILKHLAQLPQKP
jgi:hypothetical protein